MILSRIKYVIDNDQVMMDTITDKTWRRYCELGVKAMVYDYSNFPLKTSAGSLYYIHNNNGGIWRK